jgi:hypothetical protein
VACPCFAGFLDPKQPSNSMASYHTGLCFSQNRPALGELTVPSLAYRIADISFGMFSDSDLSIQLDSELAGFAAPASSCDVSMSVSLADSLEVPCGKMVFDSGGVWSLFEERDGYRFHCAMAFLSAKLYKTAWFDREFKAGHVVLSRQFFEDGMATYPLEYPLDELLMIHRLARGEGVEVHAVGIVDETGRGNLFLGHSGAGKSTSARLWSSFPGVHILSDDRIILRVRNGRIWMYGTPWHGDAGIASPDSSPLDAIYFLEHWPRNEIVPLRPGLAAAELFARSFVPRHCAEALQFTLDFLERVAVEVPCHIFRFVPDQTAVEAIRRARD